MVASTIFTGQEPSALDKFEANLRAHGSPR